MEQKDLVKYEAKDGQQITLSFDIIRKYLVQGHPEYVTSQELMYFMGLCKSRGLNPFIKDCYLIKYSQKDNAAIITSIDYFRKRAKAQRDCQGWTGGVIVERDGNIKYSEGLVLESDTVLGGWFEAQPKGWEKPHRHEVNLSGYIKRKVDGSITKFWSKENQPSQIAKVAESQGLRKLWPDEFQQLYTPEEMDESDMFKASTAVVGDEVADLNEKLKGESKAKPTEDIYKTEPPPTPEKPEPEGKKEEEDSIAAEYNKPRKATYHSWVESRKDYIKHMEEKHQKAIKAKWERFYPSVPYPLDITANAEILGKETVTVILPEAASANPDQEAKDLESRANYLENMREVMNVFPNQSAYQEALKELGYSSMNDVPPEKEDEVLQALSLKLDEFNV